MGLERRGRADQGQPGASPPGEEPRARPRPRVKSFEIDKRLVYEAWEKVRANRGAPGVDAVSIGLFEEQLRDNLYKLCNRMSSGSYFPGPVRGVEVPEDHGKGVRLLGVPNTADRVAQTAAAMLLEAKLEPVFHRDSYGYRPGRSAHDALAACRRRCWEQDWVLDLDVRAFSGLGSAFPAAEGGSSPHQRAVGPAVHLPVAGSADADAGRDLVAREKGPRRVPRSHPFWLTCLCITRPACGWTGNSRAARPGVMRTTLLRTATARNRPGR
jgi:hypothetical protein